MSGGVIDFFNPLKSSSTNKIVPTSDAASIQLNTGKVDESSLMIPNQTTSNAICGDLRKMGESDDSVARLAKRDGISLVPQLKPAGNQKMTFTELEDTINKWLDELTGLENDFHEQAENINVWDAILINNANKLSQINEKLDQLKSENTKINNQIDFIQSQQAELEELIKPLEAEKFKLMEGEGISEKDRFYNSFESVNNDLQGIALDIQVVIEQFNATNTIKDVNDPLASIGKILNLHMTLLKYIDEQIATIQFPDYSHKV